MLALTPDVSLTPTPASPDCPLLGRLSRNTGISSRLTIKSA